MTKDVENMYLSDEDEGFDIRRDPDGEWEGINGYDEEDAYPCGSPVDEDGNWIGEPDCDDEDD